MLVHLCSNFGISYRSEINDADRYRRSLLKKLDSFYREYKIFHYQSDAAEKRFQNALAIFETNKL